MGGDWVSLWVGWFWYLLVRFDELEFSILQGCLFVWVVLRWLILLWVGCGFSVLVVVGLVWVGVFYGFGLGGVTGVWWFGWVF